MKNDDQLVLAVGDNELDNALRQLSAKGFRVGSIQTPSRRGSSKWRITAFKANGKPIPNG